LRWVWFKVADEMGWWGEPRQLAVVGINRFSSDAAAGSSGVKPAKRARLTAVERKLLRRKPPSSCPASQAGGAAQQKQVKGLAHQAPPHLKLSGRPGWLATRLSPSPDTSSPNISPRRPVRGDAVCSTNA